MPGKPTIVKEGSHHEEARKRIVERKERKCKDEILNDEDNVARLLNLLLCL